MLMPFRPLSLALTTICALFAPILVNSQQSDSDGGSWENLRSFVGTRNVDSVLSDNRVELALEGLRPDDLQSLLERLATVAPIGFDGNCLIIRGNMARRGDSDVGQIFICTHTQEVHAATFSGTELTIFSNEQSYDHLPYDFRLWIDAYRLRFDLPASVENRLTAIQAR